MNIRSHLRLALTFLTALAPTVAAAAEPAAALLCHQPDISQTSVVFACGEELWLVPRAGGLARRLTDAPGAKRSPCFSPDGATVAFVGSEPAEAVFAAPVAGGPVRRLTYYPGGGTDVLGWSPDGKTVLFRSRRSWFTDTLHTVPFAGGLEQELPVREGVRACFSPDGRRLAYNPTPGPLWKGYRGGLHPVIRIYNLARDTCTELPHTEANDTFPMWRGDTLYLASDRDGTVNLFARDLKTQAVRPLTCFRDFDVKSPRLGPDAIVFEQAGRLHVLDLTQEKVRTLEVRLPDGAFPAGPKTRRVEGRVNDFALDPTGAKAVFAAWGELFVVGAGEKAARNVTDSPGVREINPAWSPDGRLLAYLSDRGGEYEVCVRPAAGGPEGRVTRDGSVYRYGPVWSPDGRRLLYSDAARRLWMVSLAERKPVLIASGLSDPAAVGRWSPDGRWVAYTRTFPRGNAGIALYSLDGGRSHALSDGRFSDRQPAFDRTGRTLYFLSDRDFRRAEGRELSFRSETGVFAAILAAGVPSPLGRKDETGPVRIDPEGLAGRVVPLPVPAGELDDLGAGERQVFYRSGGALRRYDLARQVEETLLEGVEAYRLNPQATRLLYQAPGPVFGLVDVAAGTRAGAGKLDLALTMAADPPAERRQMFGEAWRLYRDFFYDPAMHGVDWRAVRERYERLLPGATNRDDLTTLLQQMIAELGTSHQGAGDPPGPDRDTKDGLLGAEFEEADGRYRFRKIYEGESWNPWRRAPLREPGLDVREGDYLLAVDGRPLKAGMNPYALLAGTLGRRVTLRVNSRPVEAGAREVRVLTTRTEERLRYHDWVEGNRRKVEEASGGRVGYLHIPECNQWGMEEFVRGFYANADKEALLVDGRYNYGGDNSSFFVEKLARRSLTRGATRHTALDEPPGFADGPKAILVNEWCFSNGEFFPCLFRRAGVGPVIGARTAGVWYGSMGGHALMDGGSVMVSEMADWSGPERKWIGENVGMEPDLAVADPQELVRSGRDPQLERAVAYLLEQLKKAAPARPRLPPLPQERGNTLAR
jgi:tricorn protease